MLIKPGMALHGLDGDIGTVAEIVADQSADIFRGVVVSHGLFPRKRRFIPAEHVMGVNQETVEISLTKADVEKLSVPSETFAETDAADILK